MKISVIIPINYIEPNLGKIISSLSDYEVIIVGMKQKIPFGVKHKWVETKNRAQAMNIGASLATREILLFLHTDTKISKSALKKISNLHEKYVGGGCYMTFYPNLPLMHIISFFSNIRMSIFKSIYGDQCIFVRRKIFKKLNGFKNLMICEDVDFSKRLSKHGKLMFFDHCKSSAIRFLKKGILKQMLLNWYIVLLFRLGVSDIKLKRMYT